MMSSVAVTVLLLVQGRVTDVNELSTWTRTQDEIYCSQSGEHASRKYRCVPRVNHLRLENRTFMTCRGNLKWGLSTPRRDSYEEARFYGVSWSVPIRPWTKHSRFFRGLKQLRSSLGDRSTAFITLDGERWNQRLLWGSAAT